MTMKRFYKIMRTLVVTLIALIFIIPAVLYVALSLPPIQRFLCHKAEEGLSKLLTVDVDIEYVTISPFNRVTLHGVTVADSLGQPAMTVRRLGAGLNVWDYISHDRLLLDFAEVIGMDAKIYRDSVGAPLNIQPIINALSPKDKTKPPTRFDFRVNTVVIRTSSIAYDVLDSPTRDEGVFDPNHVKITGFRADLHLPQIKNDNFIIDLRRLAFDEQSGFTLKDLSGDFHISSTLLDVKNLSLSLNHSRLSFNDQHFEYDGFDDLKSNWRNMPFDIHLLEGSHIATTDLIPFLSQLDGMNLTFETHLHAVGDAAHMQVKALRFASDSGALIEAEGEIDGLSSPETLSFDIRKFNAEFNAPRLLSAASRFTTIKEPGRAIFNNLGDISLSATALGGRKSGNVQADIISAAGTVMLQADYAMNTSRGSTQSTALEGSVSIVGFDGSVLMPRQGSPLAALTSTDAEIDFDIVTARGNVDGKVNLTIPTATFHGRTINDFVAIVEKYGESYAAQLNVDNEIVYADADISATISKSIKSLNVEADIRGLDATFAGIMPSHPDRQLSARFTADLQGNNIDDIAGYVDVQHIGVTEPGHEDFNMSDIHIQALRSEEVDSLTLRSEIADATFTGKFRLSTIAKTVRSVLAKTMPSMVDESGNVNAKNGGVHIYNNEVAYNIDVKTLEPLRPLVKLPVELINTVKISGSIDSDNQSMSVRVDAPYILQGNKLIENTSLMVNVDGSDLPDLYDESGQGVGNVNFTTTMPTRKGPVTLIATAQSVNDRVDTHLEWKIDRERNFSGDINLSTLFSRTPEDGLCTELLVNPGHLVFNDTVWTVQPATITIQNKEIAVNDFRVWRDNQYITIQGRVSESPADTIVVNLEDVNLDYVFETLDISNVAFGGNATGQIYATQLLTKDPQAFTPGLDVKRLSYNHSLLGDAIIRSEWINERRAVSIIADITQPNGLKSYVDGIIMPMDESLDFSFDVDKINIGFLKPYMAAFAKDISGIASGKARLYGTFKLIDMTGDFYGEDVKLTLGITNTSYTTTDSVHLRPGRIELENMKISDINGHTAMLNGVVTHKCFKEPEFNFRISDARDLLVYDMKENPEFSWYGKVFGNGSADIKGRPGIVDINVNMATAAGTTFTYVLSDVLSAQDYKFITFRDRDQAKKDSIAALNAPPPAVVALRKRLENSANESSSNYALNFNIDITPQAQMIMVMDPVGGDRIRAVGSGFIRMAYDSANEDLRMNGTYTLESGKYNFTLQDIIIKEFTIEPGSSITFTGDPNAAQLNLTAKYQVKASLTDLDESFLEDKELNSTNVPVDAMLIVRGDIRQPDISFDIEFPTLTEESKRKIRSIINTEEMLNRQIIYLLALNRFYTPDYMNATRGNEFVSVASSTISSQLSNMLGQLSDNWSIAPNFRSDRGDFSDMEFDVALSSHLLNNRLLLNGNLGYRDKSLNNNSFIGDFDIEYLLNRSGSLRLKAYNRYNDQNYYLKSALTTQGVGIVFKRDFDSMLSFLRPLRNRLKKLTSSTTAAPADSIPVTQTAADTPLTAPADSITIEPAETTPIEPSERTSTELIIFRSRR